MKRATKMVYKYEYKCENCNAIKTIFYTVSDFGDSPYILKCKFCGELYWYSPEDEEYIKPLDEQLVGKKCVKCNLELKDNLIPTHKQIDCCGEKVSLDDDFAGDNIPSKKDMVPVEVFLVY